MDMAYDDFDVSCFVSMAGMGSVFFQIPFGLAWLFVQ
jgi:hypothetical protein